jgi:hypothetical protein
VWSGNNENEAALADNWYGTGAAALALEEMEMTGSVNDDGKSAAAAAGAVMPMRTTARHHPATTPATAQQRTATTTPLMPRDPACG